MKTIIAGSRTFTDYEVFYFAINSIKYTISSIISGHANGTDLLGEKYAVEQNIPLTIYPANWNKYGKSAGYLRNQQMAEKADQLIAFWDGKSRGTKHMIDIAKKKKMTVWIFNIEEIQNQYKLDKT